MAQRKEKTGICKSVVIATVVAIRDVVKNGFHCIYIYISMVRQKVFHIYIEPILNALKINRYKFRRQ